MFDVQKNMYRYRAKASIAPKLYVIALKAPIIKDTN
jgi:hypothetical protein